MRISGAVRCSRSPQRLTRRHGAVRAAPRDSCRRPRRDTAHRSRRRSPSSPPRIPTPARTSWKSARTAARCCCRPSVAEAMRLGARLAEPGEFTLARVSERPDRSRAGRGGSRSGRRGDAAAGACGVRSTRRHADRRHRRDRSGTLRSLLRGSKRRSIFRTRGITSSVKAARPPPRLPSCRTHRSACWRAPGGAA